MTDSGTKRISGYHTNGLFPAVYSDVRLFRLFVVVLCSFVLNAPPALGQSIDLPSLGDAGSEELPPATEQNSASKSCSRSGAIQTTYRTLRLPST